MTTAWGQRTADALAELCRRALEAEGSPTAGWGPAQLLVTVDLDSLVGGSGGWWGSGLGRTPGCRGVPAAGL